MRKKFFWLFLSVVLLVTFAGTMWAEQDGLGVMRPDDQTRQQWYEAYESAPKAYIDPSLEIPRGSLSLLSYLYYDPVERDQGNCGNCWAWAGTGVMAIDLHRQETIFDRLSVQYITSCWFPDGHFGCCGAYLADLADFYSDSSYDQALPWVNNNAHWQDGNTPYSCWPTYTGGPSVDCGDIQTTPNYPIAAIQEVTIPTYGEFETPVQNIKNVLNQGKGVWFAFWMPTKADGDNFKNFWHNQGENVIWNPDFSCYHTWSNGFAHAVLVVGYNDNDPDNSYWIVLNSWGTDGGGRPNGLFRLDMDMNYNCEYWDAAYSTWRNSFMWQTLNIDWGDITYPHPCCNTGGPGCIDPDIKTVICAADPYCCHNWWDALCVSEVSSVYGDTCECCEYHAESEGCYRFGEADPMATSDCVCAIDPYCCKYRWDSICVNEVESDYCGCCPPDSPTSPDPANGATGVALDTILSWSNPPAPSSDVNPNEVPATGISPIPSRSGAPPPAFILERKAVLEAERGKGEVLDGPNPNEEPATGISRAAPRSGAPPPAFTGFTPNEMPTTGISPEGTDFAVPPGESVYCTCDARYETGQRVVSLVDSPDGATNLPAGSTGEVICGSSTYPGWILISWDNWSEGHNGGGYCTCPVDELFDNSGWWVLCEDIDTKDVDCGCYSKYDTGVKVRALVNNPSGASGISAGDTGTVVCGVDGLPLPILISWDNWSLGHDGNGYCECPVTDAPDNTGWWVSCEEVAPVLVNCTCDSQYTTNDRVIAVVDSPDGAANLPAGSTGEVICGSTTWPGWILISWDNWSEGHNGMGYCTCPVDALSDNSGWWVHCEYVEKATCPTTYDVYFGTAGPTNLICPDSPVKSCDPGTLTAGTTYSWQVVAKNPGGETIGPVWSFTTKPGICDDPPVITGISFDGCISELCTAKIAVKASDPCGGALTYNWAPLAGGTIIGSGAEVAFDPPGPSIYPCKPYGVKVTVTSSVSGLSTSQTIGITVKLAGDANGDGYVNTKDQKEVRNHFGESGTPGWVNADVNCDGYVNTKDQKAVRNQFGQTGCGCP